MGISNNIKVVGDINNVTYKYLRNIIDNYNDIILLGNYFNVVSSVGEYQHLVNSKAIILKGDLEDKLEKYLSSKKVNDEPLGKKLLETIANLYNGISNRNIKTKDLALYNEQYIKDKIINNYLGIMEYLESIPLYHKIDNHIFVHGAINTGIKNWRNTTKETMLNGCQNIIGNDSDKIIVSGTFIVNNRKWFKKRFNPIASNKNIIILNSQNGVSEAVIDY